MTDHEDVAGLSRPRRRRPGCGGLTPCGVWTRGRGRRPSPTRSSRSSGGHDGCRCIDILGDHMPRDTVALASCENPRPSAPKGLGVSVTYNWLLRVGVQTLTKTVKISNSSNCTFYDTSFFSLVVSHSPLREGRRRLGSRHPTLGPRRLGCRRPALGPRHCRRR